MNASIFSISADTQEQIARCVAKIDTVRRLLDAGYSNEALALSAANLHDLRAARRDALMPWAAMSQGAFAGFALRSPSTGAGSRLVGALFGAFGGWMIGSGTRTATIREIDSLIDNLQSIHEDLEREVLNESKPSSETPTSSS